MYILIILFIAAVLTIGIFCVAVVCRDIVLEERERRKKSAEPQPEDIPEPDATPVMTFVAVADDQPDQVEEPAATEIVEADNGNVAFSVERETLDEKYLALSPEFRGYYDEIVHYANTVEGVKRYKNANYEEYKVGKNRLVRLKIKRGIIITEFTIYNLQFKNYVNDNKVDVKQAPATIKVIDEASLAAAKDSISIAVNAIEEEKNYKKEQARLRRAERRKKQREGDAGSSAAAE